MSKWTWCAVIALAIVTVASGAKVSKSVPQGWGEDYAAAKVRAAKEGKFVLVAVSGSDWCPWCVKMEKDVYSQPLFVREAAKKYVLTMIDCPSDKSILSPLAQKQNAALARELGVRGFPCTIIVDAKGNEVKRLGGYVQGGPKGFLAELDALMKDVTWPKPEAGAPEKAAK